MPNTRTPIPQFINIHKLKATIFSLLHSYICWIHKTNSDSNIVLHFLGNISEYPSIHIPLKFWARHFKASFRINIVSVFYRNRDQGHVISFYQKQKESSWWKPRGVTWLGWRYHWQAGMGISRSTACSGKIHLRLQANLLNIVPTDI